MGDAVRVEGIWLRNFFSFFGVAWVLSIFIQRVMDTWEAFFTFVFTFVFTFLSFFSFWSFCFDAWVILFGALFGNDSGLLGFGGGRG